MNGTEKVLNPGSIIISRIVDCHKIIPLPYVKFINISFSADFLPKELHYILNSIGGSTLICERENDFNILTNIGELLICECSENHPDITYLQKIISALLIKLNKNKGPVASQPLPTPLQKSLEYIHSEFCQNITVNDAAKIAKYSKSRYSEIFRLTTGFTFTQYIMKLKINLAMEFLAKTDMTVENISNKCGFGSVTAFRRSFRTLQGTTPGKYRELFKSSK